MNQIAHGGLWNINVYKACIQQTAKWRTITSLKIKKQNVSAQNNRNDTNAQYSSLKKTYLAQIEYS